MANDNVDWFSRFLQSGIYRESLPQDLQPRDAPQSSSRPRELHVGLPSPYQALMEMAGNSPSPFFGSINAMDAEAQGEAAAALQNHLSQPLPGSTSPKPPAPPSTISPTLLQRVPAPPGPAPAPRSPLGQQGPPKKRRKENGTVTAKPPSHTPSLGGRADLSAYNYTSPNKNSLKDRVDIVMPFDKEDAADKIIYDSATIARDVLIAAGRHPREKPLNHHLHHFQDLFNFVGTTSDLETFRWDLLEAHSRDQTPPQPPQPQSAGHPPIPQLLPLNTAQPSAHPAFPQSQPANSAKPLPTHVPSKQTRPSGLPSQSVNPEQPPVINSPKHKGAPANPPKQSAPVERTKQSPAARPRQPPVNPPQQSVTVDLTGEAPVGNPPKQPPAVELPKKSPDSSSKPSVTVEVSNQSPAKRPKRPSGGNLPKEAPTVKKPKRAPSSSLRVEVPPPPASLSKMVGKKSQRRSAQPKVEVKVPYLVFGCKWKDCHAELHNLEALKKHVEKIHVPHHVTCGWEGCASNETMASAKLSKHVNAGHLEPIAWELGDGPSVPEAGEEASTLFPFACSLSLGI